jgi:hypothetical protein
MPVGAAAQPARHPHKNAHRKIVNYFILLYNFPFSRIGETTLRFGKNRQMLVQAQSNYFARRSFLARVGTRGLSDLT